MEGYISAREAATRWDVTARQVQRMCVAGKIPGVTAFIGAWAIPKDAEKPTRTAKSKPGPKPKNKNDEAQDNGTSNS